MKKLIREIESQYRYEKNLKLLLDANADSPELDKIRLIAQGRRQMIEWFLDLLKETK